MTDQETNTYIKEKITNKIKKAWCLINDKIKA